MSEFGSAFNVYPCVLFLKLCKIRFSPFLCGISFNGELRIISSSLLACVCKCEETDLEEGF